MGFYYWTWIMIDNKPPSLFKKKKITFYHFVHTTHSLWRQQSTPLLLLISLQLLPVQTAAAPCTLMAFEASTKIATAIHCHLHHDYVYLLSVLIAMITTMSSSINSLEFNIIWIKFLPFLSFSYLFFNQSNNFTVSRKL